MYRILSRFSDQMRDIRRRRGLSQEKLAALAGMDLSYLNEVEKGKVNPSLKALNRISQALQIPLWEIFLRMEPTYKKPSVQGLKEKKLVREQRSKKN